MIASRLAGNGSVANKEKKPRLTLASLEGLVAAKQLDRFVQQVLANPVRRKRRKDETR